MSIHPQARLRLPQVVELTGKSKDALYREIKEKKFPEPIQISARSVAWIASEVFEYLEKQAIEGRKEWQANRPQSQAAARSRRANAGGGQ